jgi:hypothetical protein
MRFRRRGFSTVDFYGCREFSPKTVQRSANALAMQVPLKMGVVSICKFVQSSANRRLPITNQLLYQLSYAGLDSGERLLKSKFK